MSDLISRQAILDELEKWDWQELYLPIHFKQILDDIPSVENKGDLISRQAVIETIDSRIEQIKRKADAINKSYSHLSFAEGVHDGYCRLKCDLRILPSVENKGEWIPVSERLPEKKVKDYLACCEDGYVATIMYDNGRWLINGNNVIAWMPLPEPYKAEKGGE